MVFHSMGSTRCSRLDQILRRRINWVRIADNYDKAIEIMPVILFVEVQDQIYHGAALIRSRRSANNPAKVSEKD